jgi:hypothetical protein
MSETNTPTKIETVTKMEDVAGAHGFRIRWEMAKVQREAVSFVVWQVVGRQADGLKLALFVKEGGGEKDRFTPNIIEAEPYLSGAIHKDGRTWLTGSSVFTGAIGAKKHLALVKYLWLAAHRHIGGEASYAQATTEWTEAKA